MCAYVSVVSVYSRQWQCEELGAGGEYFRKWENDVIQSNSAGEGEVVRFDGLNVNFFLQLEMRKYVGGLYRLSHKSQTL